jgi:hypothetical protein
MIYVGHYYLALLGVDRELRGVLVMGRYMCDPHKGWTRRMNDRDTGRYSAATCKRGWAILGVTECLFEVTRCMHTRPNDQACPEPWISVQSVQSATDTRLDQAKGAAALLADSMHSGRSRSRSRKRKDDNHDDD